MIKRFTTPVMLLFCALNMQAQTGLYIPELAGFDQAMVGLMEQYKVQGAQLAISYKGRLVYTRGFGLADTSRGDSVYPNSVFRIASVSKTVTAVTCMKLVEQGRLDLDAKVFGENGLLNDATYQEIQDPRVKDITVRMLLHHSGGWNRNISGDPMFSAFFIAGAQGVTSPPSAVEVIRYMIGHENLDFTPGSQSQYSNFGYCVLGRVIEKITAQPYENFVRDSILVPLGITSMQLGRNLPADRRTTEVTYYDYPSAPLARSVYDNTTMVPWPYGGFNLEFMDAHGGWVASAQDLVKFVCAFDRFDTRPDILSEASIDSLVKPSPKDPYYAMGLGVNSFNNWWHNGSLPGTTAEIVRAGNRELNWAILLSTRDQAGTINGAVDNLVWEVLPSIAESAWPSHDLFEEEVNALPDAPDASPSIILFPNPTGGTVYFSENVHRLKITDVAGRLIDTVLNCTELDLSSYPQGVYFFVFYGKEGDAIQRSKVLKR